MKNATNTRPAHWAPHPTDYLWYKPKPRVSERQRRMKHYRPAWADPVAIERVYQKAWELRYVRRDFVVDHVVPVVSPLVCGLHVEWNLQILTDEENRAKGNKQWPDMPE